MAMFFNKTNYSANSLFNKLQEQATKVCKGVEVHWCTFDHLHNLFQNAVGNTYFERHWADMLVKEYGYMVWCRVYDTSGKNKEADKKATKAVVDFERRFK